MKTTMETHPMDELKGKLKDILKVVPSGSNIYYIDYPLHDNGGDLLIMKGTEKFFEDYNINVLARYCINDFPKKITIPKDCTIVLHGGGNFGDLYPNYQGLRERIIQRYPNHRIVILPQTIYFENQSECDKSAAIINNHKDIHLFVRDKVSLELAHEKFSSCNLYLSPDMAHQLWPIVSLKESSKEMLCFLRLDKEANGSQERKELKSDNDYQDWGTLYTFREQLTIKIISKMISLKGRVGIRLPMNSIWYLYSEHLLNKALNLFGTYKMVKTSRLHGHILSCLMDKPHILVDNSYGKNSNYYHTWTFRCKNAQLNISGN
ncbi:polysaccharide pyruvyl transferase family protein [Paenibacillus gallinarum]|uniref:Polysaccharide pyruvyl transferase family protein n=1 Tax=Paenibacillus gallinarum TaxID=2762232 RepID=A0ABR8T4W4_9BACL|nr:polysaccharide pyruvyl transferase family protein [Paenibacillus gallinarum]MBD7970808.1 polysaccharide pyruvyl transferase family protein [Paenibacillus gallinarum]